MGLETVSNSWLFEDEDAKMLLHLAITGLSRKARLRCVAQANISYFSYILSANQKKILKIVFTYDLRMQFAILLHRNRQHTLLNQATITNNFLRIPGKVKKSNVLQKVQPALRPTRFSIRWLPRTLSPGVQRTGCETDRPLTST
jgi:hypothetical protein